MRLFDDILRQGGLVVDCISADGAARARLTLQPDGGTLLRCAGPAGLLADAVEAALSATAVRMGAAAGTVGSLCSLADALVLGATLAMAALASLTAGTAQAEVLRPLLVFAAYAALVPLRGPLLRFALRRALHWASALES